ncbi:UPF0098 protein aq_1250 [Actinomycetota bacterium]|nr:UPF0098 protein aq_1250 [Actinomycetota bacterium]
METATEFSKEAVGVKDGYFDFTWTPSAALIWSSDLKLDNTILLRKVIKTAPTLAASKSLLLSSPDFKDGGSLPKEFTCDGKGISPSLGWSNVPASTESLVLMMDTTPGPLRPGEVDIGKHFNLTVFNIPKTATSISAGATNVGTLGQNFQGKTIGYTPPCSQARRQEVFDLFVCIELKIDDFSARGNGDKSAECNVRKGDFLSTTGCVLFTRISCWFTMCYEFFGVKSGGEYKIYACNHV